MRVSQHRVSSVTTSPVIPTTNSAPVSISVSFPVAGTLTYSVEYTTDPVLTPGFNPATATWTAFPEATSLTTAKSFVSTFYVTGIRLNVTARSSGTVELSTAQGVNFGNPITMETLSSPEGNNESVKKAVRDAASLYLNLPIGNIGLGSNNLTNANTSGNAIAIGNYAFASATAVNDSIAIGTEAGKNQVSCVGNTYIGRLAGEKNVTGGNNTAVGDSALRECLSIGNVAMGYVTAEKLTTGTGLVAIGAGAAGDLTTGDHNVAIGYSAMPASTTGHRNVIIGYNAANSMTGNDNVGIGRLALFNTTQFAVGNPVGENVAIGSNAGFYNTTGARNTFIGNSAGNNVAQKVDAFDSIAIGNGAFTTKDYQCVLGGPTITETVIRGAPVFIGVPASVTPANNGDLVIQETSNTQIAFKLRGTDGVVRTGTITLS